MNKPPLLLNNYFFPVISVVANPNWDQESAADKGAPLSKCTTKSSKINNSENTFEVSVSIEITDTPENPSQYNINLVAVGIFTVDDAMPNKEQNMAFTGSSILYSAAREFLLQMTSRGPWPPIMLSLISFLPRPAIPNPPDKATKKTVRKKTEKK